MNSNFEPDFMVQGLWLTHFTNIYERIVHNHEISGINVGKLKHSFSIIDKDSGEILLEPIFFKNIKKGFDQLHQYLNPYSKDNLLIGMEDTAHYHFNLLKYLLSNGYHVALINPVTTDLIRKLQGGISKNDKLDTFTICDILSSFQGKKNYRITTVGRFDLHEQLHLTRHHHNLKEKINMHSNKL